MPRAVSSVPAYRLHKQSGQAIVTVNVNGARKDITLGKHGSPESHEEYRRVLANLAAPGAPPEPKGGVTVNELCARFWTHAKSYYRTAAGEETSSVYNFRVAIRALREHSGALPAREFGPVAFKAVRDHMVLKGWARRTVNDHASRVKLIVRWGVENELLLPHQWEALRAVPGLKAGRSAARETEPVGPVPDDDFRAVLPYVRSHVRALLELLAVTGMRPGEACRIRPRDLDTSGAVWLYRPEHHKTRHRGKARVVPLGAKARAILEPLTPENPEHHFFSPKSSEAARMEEKRAARKSKVQPSQASRAKANPRRKPGGRYTPHGVACAVARACERAGVPHWHPNQLRHTFATAVRKAHGLEAAQVLLGHARADVTEVYAEKNLALAVEIAARVG